MWTWHPHRYSMEHHSLQRSDWERRPGGWHAEVRLTDMLYRADPYYGSIHHIGPEPRLTIGPHCNGNLTNRNQGRHGRRSLTVPLLHESRSTRSRLCLPCGSSAKPRAAWGNVPMPRMMMLRCIKSRCGLVGARGAGTPLPPSHRHSSRVVFLSLSLSLYILSLIHI